MSIHNSPCSPPESGMHLRDETRHKPLTFLGHVLPTWSTRWRSYSMTCKQTMTMGPSCSMIWRQLLKSTWGEDWQILYPEKGLKFEISDFLVEVRLRDDPGICGKQVLHGPHPQVKISQAFANFSRRVARLLENEEGAVQKERLRRLKLAKLHLEQIRSKKMLHVFKGSVMLLGLFLWFWFILAFKDWVLSLGSVVAAVMATVMAVLASLALWYAFDYMIAFIMWDQTRSDILSDIMHVSGHDGSKVLLSRALLAPFLCKSPFSTTSVFSFGAWISGSVRAGVRMGVSFLGRRGLHMAHSFPLVHSLLLLYLLFLCTLRLPGAFVNQGVPFRDSREDCPQHLDIQRQCDSRSFQSLRMLVAGKIWIRLANASGQKSWRSDQRCSGFSPQRFSKFWTAWSYPILRSFVGRLLVFSFIWRTETMGLQMVDDVGGQHRKGSSLRCRIAGLLFWEYEGPRQSPKFCYCWSRALPERTYLAEKGRVQGVGCLPRSGSCWPWQPQQGCRRRFFFTAQPGASATFLGLAAQGRSWIPRRIGRTWEFPKGWSRMAGKEGLPIHPGRHYPI